MKIAIIGYGKMGHEIEKMSLAKGHEIAGIIDKENIQDLGSGKVSSADVAIEFSEPGAAVSNILTCFNIGIPVVTGTTGWYQHLDMIIRECKSKKQALFYASNFSLGVNIFFEINRKLATLMDGFPEYDVNIEEIHHVHKLDAPSGTAISLANDIIRLVNRKSSWKNSKATRPDEIPVISVRKDEIAGIHTITYQSAVDCIEIKHSAKNRIGFANGAVLAAEFLVGKSGVFTMLDLLNPVEST
ncbi:MAG: 4-hydroxy-tetrahydrodipicolinate reductase [Bacteroidia bacterium]|nr:4-hydroxy-tetrahydrodipicolinate reductase [Bacteroidia bacterium]